MFSKKRNKFTNKLNLMSLNLKTLNIAGIRLQEKFRNCPMKIKLFRFYYVMMYIIIIPTLVWQIFTLYHVKDDLVATLDNLCTIAITIVGYLPAANMKWDEACALLKKMATDSIFTQVCAGNDLNKLRVFNDAQRKSYLATVIGFVFITIVVVMWITEPFVIYSIETFISGLQEENLNLTKHKDSAKVLPFNIIPPFDISSIIVYISVYIIIALGIIAIALKAGITLSFCLGVMMYVSAQFKIVAISIKNIERENDNILVYDVHEEKNSSDTDEERIEICVLDDLDDTTAMEELKVGIREHQDVIEVLKTVNSAFSSGFFHFQNIAAFVFTMNLFQLSQYEGAGFISAAKHVMLAAFILFQGGIYCWLADDIRTQGLSIWEAAYGTQWYRRSSRFKKVLGILILRGQHPNYIEIGTMHKMSIEHFANVVNMSYSFFTLLLQMKGH